MKKKLLTAIYIVLVAVAAVFIVNELDFSTDIFGTERQTKYTLYVGMNDKDTNQPKYALTEAKQVMFTIVQKYTGGCTFYEAEGCWYDDEKQAMLSEKTLVCVLLDTEPQAVKNIMDEALTTFNQSSILLETEEVRGAFYSN